MITLHTIFIWVKYVIASVIFVGILLAPAWVARQTAKGQQDMILVRLASWILCWTGIGWLWAMFWATKK